MGKHLSACRGSSGVKGSVSDSPTETRPAVRSFHIVVEDRDDPSYWMHLSVPQSTKLLQLDTFLRRVWLECCGHLSAFYISGVMYSAEDMGSFATMRSKNMQVPLYRVLRTGKACRYEYDFGTTTELTLRVVSERRSELRLGIHLLARNDPRVLICRTCTSTSVTMICQACIVDKDLDPVECYLCDECNTSHGCDEYMRLPIVNSPRMGRCGYIG